VIAGRHWSSSVQSGRRIEPCAVIRCSIKPVERLLDVEPSGARPGRVLPPLYLTLSDLVTDARERAPPRVDRDCRQRVRGTRADGPTLGRHHADPARGPIYDRCCPSAADALPLRRTISQSARAGREDCSLRAGWHGLAASLQTCAEPPGPSSRSSSSSSSRLMPRPSRQSRQSETLIWLGQIASLRSLTHSPARQNVGHWQTDCRVLVSVIGSCQVSQTGSTWAGLRASVVVVVVVNSLTRSTWQRRHVPSPPRTAQPPSDSPTTRVPSAAVAAGPPACLPPVRRTSVTATFEHSLTDWLAAAYLKRQREWHVLGELALCCFATGRPSCSAWASSCSGSAEVRLKFCTFLGAADNPNEVSRY